MEIVQFTPKTIKSLTIPGAQEVRIMPIGDIQYGASGCDVDRLQRHIKWGVDHGAYFIGMGDYIDLMSPSNRRKWAQANFYDIVHEAMNDYAAKKEQELEKILAPTKGRWLGLIKGHHYHDFQDGSTSVSRLADFLGTVELGDSAFVSVNFNIQGKPYPLKIWAHHGKGGGTTPGAPLNTLMHIAGRFFAHLYLMGHTHTKPAVPVPFIDHSFDEHGDPFFVSFNRYLVSTGSFLKGYDIGTTDPMGHPSGSYVEQAMLSPVTLGGQVIYVRPRFRSGYWCPDINVSV